MNPARTYEEFLEIMHYFSHNDTSQLIPVVIIKPSTISHLNQTGDLSRLFDYFDYRSDDIQFFLPGYCHSPILGLSILFSFLSPPMEVLKQ